jgi:hypothetical protein
MANITATFVNGYGDSRQWAIWDTGIDPNSPKLLFNDYLAPGDSTQQSLYSADGIYGSARYQRSDGAPQVVDSITDQSQVSMS